MRCLNSLGSSWYHSEPLEVSYFQNQYLDRDFSAISYNRAALKYKLKYQVWWKQQLIMHNKNCGLILMILFHHIYKIVCNNSFYSPITLYSWFSHGAWNGRLAKLFTVLFGEETIEITSTSLVARYVYLDSKLFLPVYNFADPV